MQKQQGFTIIELMITLVILGLLLGIALPAFKNMSSKMASLSAGNKLHVAINTIRSQSVFMGKSLTLCGTEDFRECLPSRDWGNHLMIFYDTDKNRIINDNETRLRQFSFAKNSTIRWRSFGNKSYLNFHPDGITYYQNGNFTWCPPDKDARYAKHYILNAAGRLYPARKDKNNNGIVEGRNGKDIVC